MPYTRFIPSTLPIKGDVGATAAPEGWQSDPPVRTKTRPAKSQVVELLQAFAIPTQLPNGWADSPAIMPRCARNKAIPVELLQAITPSVQPPVGYEAAATAGKRKLALGIDSEDLFAALEPIETIFLDDSPARQFVRRSFRALSSDLLTPVASPVQLSPGWDSVAASPIKRRQQRQTSTELLVVLLPLADGWQPSIVAPSKVRPVRAAATELLQAFVASVSIWWGNPSAIVLPKSIRPRPVQSDLLQAFAIPAQLPYGWDTVAVALNKRSRFNRPTQSDLLRTFAPTAQSIFLDDVGVAARARRTTPLAASELYFPPPVVVWVADQYSTAGRTRIIRPDRDGPAWMDIAALKLPEGWQVEPTRRTTDRRPKVPAELLHVLTNPTQPVFGWESSPFVFLRQKRRHGPSPVEYLQTLGLPVADGSLVIDLIDFQLLERDYIRFVRSFH